MHKRLNCDEIHFIVFFFFLFTVSAYPKLWRYCRIFSSRRYIILAQMFSMVWGSISDSSFPQSCWPSSSAVFAERLSFPFQCPGAFLEFLWYSCHPLFIFMPIPHCIDYGSFVSLKIREFELQVCSSNKCILNLKANHHFGIQK